MIDIKAILKANGVEESKLDLIADSIKSEIPKSFVSKEQYNKKVNAIDDLNNTIADLEAKAGTDEFKKQYETLKTEYDTFKTNLETEKVNTNKTNLLKDSLKGEGVNEKLINLLLKEFDLGKLEIEENKIKGWEEVVKPVKESYGDFFTKQTTTGNPPANPPIKGNEGNIKTPYVPPTLL